MEKIFEVIVGVLAGLYKILELSMPFMIWHIYNKIDEIDDKIERR